MKNYIQIVMDALALDGEGQNWNSFIDLDAHDRQYHHGHYDGGTCSLRDKLGNANQPGGLLDGMPSLDQFNTIVRQAINSGMIDENGREEINNILNDVANGLQNWEGGDEASVRQSVEEMKELYDGLRDAFAQQVREEDVETPNGGAEPVNEAEPAETTQPQPTASATNGTPTEEQIEHAIDRVMETYPNGSRNDIRDVFNQIANGDAAMARAAHQTLLQAVGEDDPIMRFVQGVIDGTQPPHQAGVAQTTQTQTPQPTPAPAQATAAEPVTRITDIIHRRPDVAINIAANKAPRSMNESLRRIAAQAVGRTSMQLRREGMGQATREILTALQNGTMNDAGRRYLLAMEQAAINGQMGSQSYPNVVVRAANRINPNWRDVPESVTPSNEQSAVNAETTSQTSAETETAPSSQTPISQDVKVSFIHSYQDMYSQAEALNPKTQFSQMLEFSAMGYGYQCAKKMMDTSSSAEEALGKMSGRANLLLKRHGAESLGFKSMRSAISDFCAKTGLEMPSLDGNSPSRVAPREEPPVQWTENDFEDAMRLLNARFTYGDETMRTNLRNGLTRDNATMYMDAWKDALGENHVIYRRLKQMYDKRPRRSIEASMGSGSPTDAEIDEANRFRPEIVLDSQVHDFRNSSVEKGFSFARQDIPLKSLHGSCNCFKVSASTMGAYLTRLKSRPNACSGSCYGDTQNSQFRNLIDSELRSGWVSLDAGSDAAKTEVLKKLAASGIDGIAMETWSGGHSTNKFIYNGVIYNCDTYYSDPKFKVTTPESTAAHISNRGEFAGNGSTAFIPNSSMKIPSALLSVLHVSSQP